MSCDFLDGYLQVFVGCMDGFRACSMNLGMIYINCKINASEDRPVCCHVAILTAMPFILTVSCHIFF